jgi:hypothetical protein
VSAQTFPVVALFLYVSIFGLCALIEHTSDDRTATRLGVLVSVAGAALLCWLIVGGLR